LEASDRQFLSASTSKLGLDLEPAHLDRLCLYEAAVRLWNRRMNLVSAGDEGILMGRHLLDSLTLAPLLTGQKKRLFDLGSGAGFPGIPLKIVKETWDVILVEASRKRASFLKEAVRTLQLPGVTVVRARAEDLLNDDRYRASADWVVSRAAFKLPDLLRLASPLLKPGGQLAAPKGFVPEEEWSGANKIANNLGMLLHNPPEGDPEDANRLRKIVVYKKSF